MEHQIRAKCFDLLSSSTATASTPPQQALILSLSLILNSSTSDSTLSSLFQNLTLSLHPNSHPLSLVPTLSLLSTLASHRPHLSRPIFDSIRSFSLLYTHTLPRTLAASLSVLASLAESNQTLVSELNECSERLFLTLCFQTSVSVRRWTLLNAGRLRIRPSLLLTVLLGFTRDPYPYLRGVALDGLVGLCKSVVVEDRELVETCCRCAVELFGDMEDCVRCAAVRAVAQWGQLLVALNHDSNSKNLSNALFLQLCSMVRDMSLRVRVEAFDALGEINMVSEEILLRTLSKKPLSVSLQGSKPILQQCGLEQKTNSGLCSTKQFEIPASNAAGVFVHGLEDEFSEVRRSACHSLHTLSILSADFSCEALNLLMDVLNDDSMVVRIQALETLRCMALFDRLKVQETHMHMFLSTLVDTSVMVRSAARKVLRIIKLEDVAIFKLSVDGLLENLEMYPQDEADVFSVLFSIGRRHGNFTADLIAGVSDEIEPGCEGKLVFDGGRVAALLVLAISAPLSHEQYSFTIPPRIFSYAVTLLGRISHALNDVMDQDTLLAYLSHCSSSTIISSGEFDFKRKESFLLADEGSTNNALCEKSGLHQLNGGTSGSHYQEMGETTKVAKALVNYQVEDHGDVMKSVEFMLERIKYIWQLIQVGYTGEALQTLRSWKEELAKFATSSSAGALAFSLQHLRVAKLLAKIWPHFISPRKLCSYGMGELGLLLGKLDRTLKEMKYKFIGLSKQDELLVLELILLNCILRLSSVEAYTDGSTVEKLHSTLSQIEFLYSELSIEPSNFVSELKKSFHETGFSTDGQSCSPLLFQKSLEFFSLKQFVFCVKLKHIKAELDVSDNAYDNPFPFTPGLPVGIPLEITVSNISRENRLWLRLAMDEALSEFVFLDFDRFGGNNQIRKFRFVAPFYKTPKANSFTVKLHDSRGRDDSLNFVGIRWQPCRWKIQRSLWRDGGHGIRRSPRISALDAWKYSEEEEMEDHHQRPPSGTKRKLHQHGIESQNQDDNSTNSDQPLVTKAKESTKLDDHPNSTGQSSVMTPASFMPEKRILELVVDILQRRDTYEIFGEPVDPKEVEDYYEIIEEPMDFGTMRAKLHEELYKNLEQFEHDAFLIPRNAMHFNSTATVYFRQARAIYELAKKVFHVLKTDPENLESEFSLTRRRSCRRPQGEGKTLNFNSCRRVTTNVRTRSSLSGPSNLRRSNWGNPGFSSTANKRDYDFYPGVRDSRRSNIIDVDKRSTYRPLMSYENESDSIVSTVNSGPKLLVHATLGDISYRESLMMFARDLGPIAQMIANRKLKGWSKDSPVFQTPSSNSWGQTSVSCPFPTTFVSAQKGPTTLDTPITNPSGDFFDSLHGHCSEVESTPDIIDLTIADDGEKANTNNAFTGKCATNNNRARMGNHSSLVWKVATNNAGDTTGNNSGFNNEESTRHESDWIKRFSISDSDNKIHEKEINKIHRSWFTSTSGTEELSSAATGIRGTSTKSISLTLDSGKMDAQEQQATLASFSSQLSDQSELKLRNSNSSTTYPWPWHPVGDSKHEPVEAVKYKGGTNCSSSSQASYSAESNQLKPLASPFAFDLRFLKSRLHQMNSQNGSLQSQFQQGNDKEGPSSSQMRLSTQPSQLASLNHQHSVWDTNLALKL